MTSNVECFESSSPEQTRSIAAQVASQLSQGDLLALQGDLGAGKTVWAQGMALGLGVDADQVVRSPTFSIFNIHKGKTPFVHVDLYRIADPDEVEALGLLDLLPEHVMAVEWFEQAYGMLGSPRVLVEITDHESDPNSRLIVCRWTEI